MVKEIYKDIYTFEVALPNSALKQLNSYIVKGEDRSFLIDTGYNNPESKESLLDGIKSLGLELSDLDLVITHLHADHSGLVSMFYDAGCKVYASKIDGDYFNSMATGAYDKLISSFVDLYGIDHNEIDVSDNAYYNNRLDHEIDFIELKPGDELTVGDFTFEVVDLAGHTPGHIGLFDRDKKIIFSADTVLDPITPTIAFWGFDHKNILGTYIDTLTRIRAMDIDLMYTSHGKIITNHLDRTNEIIHHHYVRMQEILNALDNENEFTVKDIITKINWRFKVDSWDDLEKHQKWYTSGETMSHMELLAGLGYLEMRLDDNTLKFKKIKNRIIE